MSIWYYPLSFGLVIGIINWEAHKYNAYIGVLLSVVVSFISFWLAFFSTGIFSFFCELITNNTNIVIGEKSMINFTYIIAPSIIAPLLVFLSYGFVFDFSKEKFTKYIILISIVLLILQSSFFYSNNDFLKDSRLIPFTIWQVIMTLSLQLVLHQKAKLEKPVTR